MNQTLDSASAERPARLLLPATIALAMVALALITFGMTPLTYLLDEIKVSSFIILGPLLLLLGLGTLVRGEAPAPPRLVTFGLVAYGAVMALSALSSRYSWAGWHPWLMFWAAAGFFLAGHCAGTSRRASENFIRFLSLLLLAVCLIGFFMFDLTGSSEQHSGVSWLFHSLYGTGPMPGNLAPKATQHSLFYNFLRTLSYADASLQSTILNRDFFNSFCIFLLPFPMLLALDPSTGRRRWAWRLIGYAATLLGVASAILATFSPMVLLFNLLVLILFVFFWTRISSGGAWRPLLALGGVSIGWLALLLALFPKIFNFSSIWTLGTDYWKSHTLGFDFWKQHLILWRGALGIFRDHPVLGGGPGTFVIYFPNYRAPDFYLHGINNVTTRSQNIFLDVLSQTGIFGLASFLLLLGALIVPAWKLARRVEVAPRTRGALLAVLTALVVMLLANCFSPVGLWPIGMAPLWSVMGLLAGLCVQARESTNDTEMSFPEARPVAISAVRRWALAAFALSLILLPLSVHYGVQYFRCAMSYAEGMNYLETASSGFQEGGDAQTIEPYFQKSIGYFQQALPDDIFSESAYYKLGSAYTSLSQLESSLSENARKKGDLEAAGRHEAVSDDYLNKAIESYETLAALSPDYAEIAYNFGIIYHLAAQVRMRDFGRTRKLELKQQADDFDRRALQHLLRMSRLSHKKEVALLAGSQLLEMGQYKLALDILKAASDREPRDQGLAAKSYEAATKAGDTQSAAQARQRLAELEKLQKTGQK